MQQRALITGGAGFLGTRIANALKSRYSVILADVGSADHAAARRATGAESIELDVTDVTGIRAAFAKFRPDLVVHAAANKYVDLGEKDPFGCVDVNLAGSENIARVAMETGVGVVVGISSTAAAPPQVSVYGLSKAIMERMFCSLNGKTKTRFTSVRLANVAWSTGSALPLWRAALAESGVVSSTGPEQRRFLFSADEAVGVVMTAIDNIDAIAGKVLVPKAKQAQMKDLLERLLAVEGGTWKRAEERAGDRPEEVLVGDLEVPYTGEAAFGGVAHYVISFNQKAAPPIVGGIIANKAEALSPEEIAAIVASAPA